MRQKSLFSRIRHFDQLPPEVQERLTAVAVLRHFEAGQVIYVEGEPAESIFIIENGWVKATRMSRQGREQALLFLHSYVFLATSPFSPGGPTLVR